MYQATAPRIGCAIGCQGTCPPPPPLQERASLGGVCTPTPRVQGRMYPCAALYLPHTRATSYKRAPHVKFDVKGLGAHIQKGGAAAGLGRLQRGAHVGLRLRQGEQVVHGHADVQIAGHPLRLHVPVDLAALPRPQRRRERAGVQRPWVLPRLRSPAPRGPPVFFCISLERIDACPVGSEKSRNIIHHPPACGRP